ncbi:unnamed protein product [Ranitomeya imitator]|uniref:Uncharacterized protein n=1 Tax=Ranitomeya imitator TaxID=111125 RepID=A0ABN9L5B0_9NEOB|nr:unnamed protein product [Ranitomeya imitator]
MKKQESSVARRWEAPDLDLRQPLDWTAQNRPPASRTDCECRPAVKYSTAVMSPLYFTASAQSVREAEGEGHDQTPGMWRTTDHIIQHHFQTPPILQNICTPAPWTLRTVSAPKALLVPAENPANVRTANVQHAKKAAAPAVRLSAVSAARAVSAAMDVTPAAAASDRRYTRIHGGPCDICSMASVIRAPVIAVCVVYV